MTYREGDMVLNPSGICGCGCGRQTSRARRSYLGLGYQKGDHFQFCPGHRRSANTYASGQYNAVWRKHNGVGRMTKSHVAIVEDVIGKRLRRTAPVHHVNGHKRDNRKCNLVVCHDAAYHALLHVRGRALDACGHADWRHCFICDTWDNPGNLYISPTGKCVYHRECYRLRQRRERYGLE